MVSQNEQESRREEAKTIESLMNALNLNDTTMTAIRNARSNEEYAAEKNLFPSAWEVGLPQGLAAGVASIFILNGLDSIVLKRANVARSSIPLARTLTMSLLTAAVSTANAFLVANACQDKEKVLSNLSKIPLTSGKSVVSDSFCKDLSQEYKRLHSPEYYKNVQSPLLVHMGVFVHNCELRQAYERQLRKQQDGVDESMTLNGPASNESAFIPPPGVPTSVLLTSQDDGGSYKDMDSPQEGFDFGQEETFVGDDWTDTFGTTDQEDSIESSGSGRDWK